MTIQDKNGKTILDHDGYVPDFFFGGGDYIELTIDNETGKIEGWKPITVEQIKEYHEEEGYEAETEEETAAIERFWEDYDNRNRT
jgi:hypothetical protein